MTTTINTNQLSKEHLKRIGKRMRQIRTKHQMTAGDFTEKLNLAGAVMSRFENGKGIQIFNLLTILSWLDSEGYNIKWFLLYDNDHEFEKNEDSLALYTDTMPKHTLAKKQLLEQANQLENQAKAIEKIANEFL